MDKQERKEYYSKNKERFARNSKKWREKNPNYVKEHNKAWKEQNKDRVKRTAQHWRQKYKKEIVLLKINEKCVMCGWNEHSEILQYHHRNPMEKEIQIGKSHHNIDKIKEEIKKCILLCPNCHMWLHYKGSQK